MKGEADFLEGGDIVAGNEHIHKALIDVANRPVPKA
jgi:myo-inositol-1(or 4)-monophosphatase